MFLEVKEIEKSYGAGESYTKVLRGVSTTMAKGKICVILGPSGSGKSTLLNAIGGLDGVDKGAILIDGLEITKLKPEELVLYRKNYLGFIFQFYNLVPNLTVKENIQVCEYLTDSPLDLGELLGTLGLTEHRNKFPFQLSGGQQQRCAIARALVKKPRLLLCDEPTGALDYKMSKEILLLLERVNQAYETTILMVSHNIAIKDMAHKVIRFKDGKIEEDYENTAITPAADLEW